MGVMKMLLHVDDFKITACVIQNRKTLSGETFCFPEKCLLSISKFCASSNLYFFLRATDWFTTNFLGPKYC